MKNGFTLIELLVSVAIFATVMTMSLGALLAMSESNRRVESMKSVINTLNFTLDAMSRSIRTGTEYNVVSATQFSFTSADGEVITYCRGTTTACSAGGTFILRAVNGGSPQPLTSREVIIETLSFYGVGTSESDTIQPKITILLTGYVDVSATQRSRFELQTSVTQRIYDDH